MRTTIDLPDDLHRVATSIARDSGQTLSQTVARLLREALGRNRGRDDYLSPVTGLPVIRLGDGLITTEDVRALDDDE